ncbi:hypothetical protein [Rhodobacteraceae phage LS06-2018-MD07]|jgi:hypothetical protein|nr:hypothetical protein [Rhodobacteraceae phage LS06-2018-MD07]
MRIPDLGQSIYALGQSVSNLGQNVARYNTQQIQARRTQEVNNGLANVSNDFAVRSRSLFRDFESSMQNFTSSVDMRTADLGTQYQIWKEETRALYAQQYEGDEEMSEAVNQYLDGQFFNLDQQFNTRSEELYDSLVVKETGDQFIQAAEAQNFQGIDAMEAQMITNIENGEQWTFNEQQIRDMANLAREQAVINVIADDTASMTATQARDYAMNFESEMIGTEARNQIAQAVYERQTAWMGGQDTANHRRIFDTFKNAQSITDLAGLRQAVVDRRFGYTDTQTDIYWLNQIDAQMEFLQNAVQEGVTMADTDMANSFIQNINVMIGKNESLEDIRQTIWAGEREGLIDGETALGLVEDAEGRLGRSYVQDALVVFDEQITGVPGQGIFGTAGKVTLNDAQKAEAEHRLLDEVDRLVNDNSNNFGTPRDIDMETIMGIARGIAADMAGETAARRVENIALYNSLNDVNSRGARFTDTETLVDFIDADGMMGRVDQFEPENEQIQAELRDYFNNSISAPNPRDRYGLYGLFTYEQNPIREEDVWTDSVSGRPQMFIESNYESEFMVELPDGRRGYVISTTIINGSVAPVVFNPESGGDGAQLRDYAALSTVAPKLYLGKQKYQASDFQVPGVQD